MFICLVVFTWFGPFAEAQPDTAITGLIFHPVTYYGFGHQEILGTEAVNCVIMKKGFAPIPWEYRTFSLDLAPVFIHHAVITGGWDHSLKSTLSNGIFQTKVNTENFNLGAGYLLYCSQRAFIFPAVLYNFGSLRADFHTQGTYSALSDLKEKIDYNALNFELHTAFIPEFMRFGKAWHGGEDFPGKRSQGFFSGFVSLVVGYSVGLNKAHWFNTNTRGSGAYTFQGSSYYQVGSQAVDFVGSTPTAVSTFYIKLVFGIGLFTK